MENPGLVRQRTGRMGEALAAWFLERRGYRIRGRNVRVGRFEIDLVVERGRSLIFVEVKFRRASAWDGAGRALGCGQRRRLAAAAAGYAARVGRGREVRFDVVTIEESDERLVVEHVRDAFGADGEVR